MFSATLLPRPPLLSLSTSHHRPSTGDPVQALRTHFGFPGFRPGQEELVRAALEGRDSLGVLPTGGGKSLCYQVPALLLGGVTVVVTPLVSLMEDQVRRGREVGISSAALHAALPPFRREEVLRQARGGDLRLLFVAPERLETRGFQDLLPHLPIRLVTVDEAHCIAFWGHDFRPSYLKIGEIRTRVAAPVMALTATATPRVREEILRELRLRDPVRVLKSFDRPNLGWGVVPVPGGAPRIPLLRALVRRRSGARLIYASTRREVEGIRNRLVRTGMEAQAYHAGLPPAVREEVQGWFTRAPAPLVVATNAFGMGIDRADVRMVVHNRLPGTLEDYYQEAGRAGRDGAPALCLALAGPGDGGIHRRFLDGTHPPLRTPGELLDLVRGGPARERWRRRRVGWGQMRAVRAYARGGGCRRRAILAHFGESGAASGCGACDRCTDWESLFRFLESG
jgi:ATP-dependent DNA helicase RecQ